MIRNTCTRRLTFCAGHRVLGHENKCSHLHGHNYTVFIHARTAPHTLKQVDSIGRVIDFSALKAAFDPFIQHYWDHGFLVAPDDLAVLRMLESLDTCQHGIAARLPSKDVFAHRPSIALRYDERAPHCRQKLFVMPYNPTAENIAKYLLEESSALLGTDSIEVFRVVVHETDNCYAEAHL